jgi:hypothetical protein
MADTLTPQGMKWDFADEHQGRKFDEIRPLALNHMNQHRHPEGRDGCEEQWGQKRHQRTFVILWRIARYLNNA